MSQDELFVAFGISLYKEMPLWTLPNQTISGSYRDVYQAKCETSKRKPAGTLSKAFLRAYFAKKPAS